jgi:hypothetical protein
MEGSVAKLHEIIELKKKYKVRIHFADDIVPRLLYVMLSITPKIIGFGSWRYTQRIPKHCTLTMGS